MKTAVLTTVLCLFSACILHAADAVPLPPVDDGRLPGVGLAEFITQSTGVAVSPLLGVCGVGAWKYWFTAPELRGALPWYCQPWAWGTGWTILALTFLKDFLGTGAPPLVKKPLDFIELFENKLSAIVAMAGFVPFLALAAAQVDAIPPNTVGGPMPAELGLASVPALGSVDISWGRLALYTPVGLIIFAVVWLSCHSINVLVALSPFGLVDAGLKLVKLALISVVTGASLIHPLLGLVVCVPLIVTAAFVCGWSFRLTVFGTVFGWDFLTGRMAGPEDLRHGAKGFIVRRLPGVPPRTWGELRIGAGGVQVFRHRPWLVFRAREVPVPTMMDGVTKGLLHPTITGKDDKGKPRAAFILPPRYRHCVEQISRRFGITSIMDSTLMRGLKAMRHWLVEMLSVGRNLVERGQQAWAKPAAVPRLQASPRRNS